MGRSRRLNLRRRIVIVVGLGVGFALLGTWVTGPQHIRGWTGSAPLSSSATYRSTPSIALAGESHLWVRLAIWLALTVVWTLVSVVLLRTSPET